MAGGRLPRRAVRLLVVGGVVVGAWAVWLGVDLVLVRGKLEAGRRAVSAAERMAEPADIAEGRPLGDLRQARSRFQEARQRLSRPPWVPVRYLPVIGRQLRSLVALSSAAEEAADAGIDGVLEMNELLDRENRRGAARVTFVRQLAELADRTERRLASIRLGPRLALLPPLAERRNELADRLAGVQSGLRRASVAGSAVADVLAGPRTYLVFGANNAEMRAGSGMFLSVGVLETRDGELRLSEMSPVTEIPIPPGAVAVEGDLADRWGWLKPSEEWRNLMVSPRFDVSAPLAARMWEASKQTRVDGVLALDPVTIEAILRATGPVAVEGRQIGADGVIEELTHRQYLRFPSAEERPERRELLAKLATSLFTALDEGRAGLGSLAGGLARAARGRHLLVWSAVPADQAAWETAQITGSLNEDSLLLGLLNRAGNKLDRFVQISAELTLQPSGNNTVGTLEVTVQNRAPVGEPSYVIGPHWQTNLKEGEYVGILTVNLPGRACDNRIEGVDHLAVSGADGPTRVIGSEVRLVRGESRTLRVRFRLPGRHGNLTVEPTARVPSVEWKSGRIPWKDAEKQHLAW